MKFILSAAVVASVLGQASAHSWVEELQVIDPTTGNYTGDYGYTRGYVARTDSGFNGDSVDYLLPPLVSGRTRIDGTDLLCHPSQRTSNYANTNYPRLKATPGSYVAMKYLENGHVTLPQNQPGKPKSGGTVFVYSTSQPSDTEKIADVLKWNSAGTGGDKRGAQIAAQNFDDGRCHQINPGTISTQRQTNFPDRVAGQPDSSVEQWCETDVHVPTTYKTGDTLTVYWVWQWPTEPGVEEVYPTGKDEYYTSCAEIEIVDSVSDSKPVHTLVQQDPQTKAVSDFKSRAALTTSALYTLAGSSGSISATPMAASSTLVSSSATTSAVASSSASKAPNSESSDLPKIVIVRPPFANSTSSSGPSFNPTKPFPSHGSGNPSLPFFSPPAGKLPSFVTVTNTVTMSAVANKQQGSATETKTKTEFVTSYVTAIPSTVLVPGSTSSATSSASSASSTGISLPTVVALPDAAGNAGLIGRAFRL
ncbi:hypothetical protein E4T42_07748 [Aureobasidium subglaciale]|nr:hypothetical protein E4T42_07748 [Aureobasidium subglaciale]